MVIHLTPELESTLSGLAQREGTTPEALAIQALRDRFLTTPPLEMRDDWERQLLSAASPCGVALSNQALSSEGLYE